MSVSTSFDQASTLGSLAGVDRVCCAIEVYRRLQCQNVNFRMPAAGIMGNILSTHLVPCSARGRAISTGHDMASSKPLSLHGNRQSR